MKISQSFVNNDNAGFAIITNNPQEAKEALII